MKTFNALLAASAALFALCATLLGAQTNPYESMAKLEVRQGWRAAPERHIAALEITLQPGWKTYWRAPGDAGIPPVFVWNGSRNIAAVGINWPTPVVFDQSGMTSVGYKQNLVLPLTITPKDTGKAAHLSGAVQIGICKEVCVPVSFTFSADLPAAKATTDPVIAAALADQPYSAKEAKLRAISCEIVPTADGLELSATLEMPPLGGEEYVVFETGDPLIWASEAITQRKGNLLNARTTLVHSSGGSFALERSALRLTVLGGHRAVDIRGCPAR